MTAPDADGVPQLPAQVVPVPPGCPVCGGPLDAAAGSQQCGVCGRQVVVTVDDDGWFGAQLPTAI